MREHEDVADVVEDGKVTLDYIPDDNSSNSPRRLTESTPAGGVVNGIPNSRHLTESSPEFLGLTGPAEPWARGIKGEDVVIGILDSGIWPEHPSFADDGSYDTLDDYTDLPCTFGNTEHNPMDDPFDCNNKLLGARNVLDTYRALVGFEEDEFDSARDSSGHGTHTASTAGGNEGVPASLNATNLTLGKMSGVAPRARIIAYKVGGIVSDIIRGIDFAIEDGVDVINFSIGGRADGLGSLISLSFLNAAAAGIHVATSAGNSGPRPSTTTKTNPWQTVVGASTQAHNFQGSALVGNGKEYFGVSITKGTDEELPLVDAADAGSELCIPGELNSTIVQGNIVLCKRGAIARVAKSKAVAEAGGKGMIFYNDNDEQDLLADLHLVPSVHINYSNGTAIKAYIESTGADAVAKISDAVAAFDDDAPVMAGFSSRGPQLAVPGIIKPDITAPGVQVLAGFSPASDSNPNELFAILQGTSMSSPHIAGIFAQIKQVHPDWSPAMAKSAIMTTAYQDVLKKDENGNKVPADPFDMGAGHVSGGKVGKGSMFEPGLVYDAGLDDYLGFLCDAAPEEVDPLTCDKLESKGIPTKSYNLNYPSIGITKATSSKTVVRTVTSVANENGFREYEAVVDAPKGFEIKVEPSSIRLKQGDTVTFNVTSTNTGAPVEEWRFGSLKWVDKTGNYVVYSPIAVQSVLLEIPYQVSKRDEEEGSSSFDMAFGYTGSYSAFAEGLLAANVMSDVLDDDLFKEYEFDLTDTALFRVAFVSDDFEGGDDELYINIFDPSGKKVESRQIFSPWVGGATPLVSIDVILPEEGLYTVKVEHNDVGGESITYDLYTWRIPPKTGGSLSVDSAPLAAELGETGTVKFSWEGATAGQWYLGGIVHFSDGNAIGLTIVDVDNRDSEADVSSRATAEDVGDTTGVLSKVGSFEAAAVHEKPGESGGSMIKHASVWVIVLMSTMALWLGQ